MIEPLGSNVTGIFKQSIRARRSRVASLFLLFALLWFVATAPGSAQANALQPAAVAVALQKNFGSALEAATAFTPFYLTGDFDGDGAQDIVIVALVKAGRSVLPKDVRALNPFESEGTIKFPSNPATEKKLVLAIIHGWQNPKPSGKFLLIGDSPILILDHARITSSQTVDRQNLIELMSKRGRRPKASTFPRSAKGDVILLGNQVGDNTPLYWNGRTYVWEDSAED